MSADSTVALGPPILMPPIYGFQSDRFGTPRAMSTGLGPRLEPPRLEPPRLEPPPGLGPP
jgi:hypothetical protein